MDYADRARWGKEPLPRWAVARTLMSAERRQHPRRLSALDGSFLRLDTHQSPMHVGWSAVFAAPGDRPRPTVQALRERAARRLHEVPWSRWRLAGAPLGLSEPRWIEDAGFDLDAHVVQLTGAGDPVTGESFETLRSAVLSAPLDRSRPLWQVFLVPRLEDGRVGMIGKIHHALVDGMAALRIARLFVDRRARRGASRAVAALAGDARPRGRGRLGARRGARGDRRRRRRAARGRGRRDPPAPGRHRRGARGAAACDGGRRGGPAAGAVVAAQRARSDRGARSSATARRASCCAPRAAPAARSTTSA